MGLLWTAVFVIVIAVAVHEVAHVFFLEHPSELAGPTSYFQRIVLEYWRSLSVAGQDFVDKWR